MSGKNNLFKEIVVFKKVKLRARSTFLLLMQAKSICNLF